MVRGVAADARGSAKPIREIAGSATGLMYPVGIAIGE